MKSLSHYNLQWSSKFWITEEKIESGIYKLFIVLVDVNIQSILSSKIVDLQL